MIQVAEGPLDYAVWPDDIAARHGQFPGCVAVAAGQVYIILFQRSDFVVPELICQGVEFAHSVAGVTQHVEIQTLFSFSFLGELRQIWRHSDNFAAQFFYFRVNFLQLNQRIVAVASPHTPVEIEDHRSFFAQMFQVKHLTLGAGELEVWCFLAGPIALLKHLASRFVKLVPIHDPAHFMSE